MLGSPDASASPAALQASPASPLPIGVPCPLAETCRDWRREALYRTAMHRRAMEREEQFKAELAELRTENRDLLVAVEELEARLSVQNKLLFAPSTERRPAGGEGADAGRSEAVTRRRRGQQPGAKGHGRRPVAHLPAVVVEHDLPEAERRCATCGLLLRDTGGAEVSEQVEIEVRAHRRIHRRKKYRRTCGCPETPKILTAPRPPAVIPKGRLGLTVWVAVLLDKFHFLRPTYRLLRDFASHDLFVSQGTVTDGLHRLAPLFEPVYLALRDRCRTEDHWHADETGWLVFERTADERGTTRRYLWIFKSRSAAVYVLSVSRGAEVPRAFFGPRAAGIISADRYSAYKCLLGEGMILVAFCWAHVRRDFLRLRDGSTKHARFAQAWVDRIARLYVLNDRRLSAAADPTAFESANEVLRLHLKEMEATLAADRAADPPAARGKLLESLANHWEGLTLFFAFPEIPLDNNEAERLLRSPVVGRKNYYGSGSEWSGHLAAMMFSIFGTLTIHGIEPRRWLTGYLGECARRQGRPPEDVGPFLPWNLSPWEKADLAVKRGSRNTG
jgi:transposase